MLWRNCVWRKICERVLCFYAYLFFYNIFTYLLQFVYCGVNFEVLKSSKSNVIFFIDHNLFEHILVCSEERNRTNFCFVEGKEYKKKKLRLLGQLVSVQISTS